VTRSAETEPRLRGGAGINRALVPLLGMVCGPVLGDSQGFGRYREQEREGRQTPAPSVAVGKGTSPTSATGQVRGVKGAPA